MVIASGLKVKACIEIKYTNSPHLTRGNYQAFEDLNGPFNFVVTPSSDDFPINNHIRVCSLRVFIEKYLSSI